MVESQAFYLRTLAAFELCDATGERRVLNAGKTLALVLFLTDAPGHTASREELIDLLWGGGVRTAGDHSLRQAIWQIRQRLGRESVVSRDGLVTLRADVTVDCDELLEANRSSAFEKVIAMYRGDFLLGIKISGGESFDHWVDARREDIRQTYLHAVEMQVAQCLNRGSTRLAVSVAADASGRLGENRRARSLHLKTALEARDPVETVRAASALERYFADTGMAPDAEVSSLLEEARGRRPDSDGSSSPPGTLQVPELIGREHAFAAVLEWWASAQHGPAVHVHVDAPAGLGKTRFLAEVFRRLRSQGGRAVSVRAHPGERELECAFASHIARALGDLPGAAGVSPASAAVLVDLHPTLSNVFPNATPASAGGDVLRRRTAALQELLETVVENRPIAVLLDDLHWMDDASTTVLHAVIDHSRRWRVLFVTTGRKEYQAPIAFAAAHRIGLIALDLDQVETLVGTLARLPDAAWARALPAGLTLSTGGSPLLVIETLQYLRAHETLVVNDGVWVCADESRLAKTLSIGGALRRRIADLDPDERWALTLLAVAGRPVRVADLAAKADEPADRLANALGQLEVLGLCWRQGDAWMPVHDEIAAVALEGVAEGTRRTAHLTIGRGLARCPHPDHSVYARAARHLLAAGADTELSDLFVRRFKRRDLPRLPVARLVQTLLGPQVDSQVARRLEGTVSWWDRLGQQPAFRMATRAAAPALLIILLAWVAWPRLDPPDAFVVVFTEDGRMAEVQLRSATWRAADGPIGVPRLETDLLLPQSSSTPGTNLRFSPDGSRLAFTGVTPDGGQEIFVNSREAGAERITRSPGDDNAPSWSPDGRHLVFTTARWNSQSWDDLAVLDRASGRVRQLTEGEGVDQWPTWSPDGTRVAFTRRFVATQRPPEVCWVAVREGDPACRPAPAEATLIVLGWIDGEQVVVAVNQPGFRLKELQVWNVRTWLQEPLASGRFIRAQLSHDGRWVAWEKQPLTEGTPDWWIFPSSRPREERRLRLHPAAAHVVFRLPAARRRWIESLVLEGVPDTLPMTAPYRPRIAAVRADRTRAMPSIVTWTLDAADGATVDPRTGEIIARIPGVYAVHASAGGWRTAETRLTFGDAPWSGFSETWMHPIDDRWRFFGDPKPETVLRGGRAVLWVRGDGSYPTGVYGPPMAGRRGIGFETTWAIEVNDVHWQKVDVALIEFDSSNLKSWDHETGPPPVREGRGCGFRVPRGDGAGEGTILVALAETSAVFADDVSWTGGGWHRARVQLFPDGRCAVAVDGHPLWISSATIDPSADYRVLLVGQSVGTEALLGPIETWEGVRPDIDWRVLAR